jgi:hypothetical protein
MQSRDLRYVGVRMTPELQERLLAAARRQGDASLAAMCVGSASTASHVTSRLAGYTP